MPCYNTDHSVKIWIQMERPAEISLCFQEKDKPDTRKCTETVKTQSSNANTYIFELDELQANTQYTYEIILLGVSYDFDKSLSFFTQPEGLTTFDFRMSTGSCVYINDKSTREDRRLLKWGGKYQTLDYLAETDPDYMLWLGDNIYLREGEWNSREGYYYRYTHTRKQPEMQAILRGAHHIATWDDHDYGPNNSSSSWKGKDNATEIFYDFWGNPSQANPDKKGIYSVAQIGDVEVYLMDDRYFRGDYYEPNIAGKDFLGEEQIAWLISQLKESKASFKLIAIGSQVLTDCTKGEGYFTECSAEWGSFINRLKETRVPGMVFLSGDKHFTELSRLDDPDFYPMYDLTVSPITSIPNPILARKNSHSIKGTFVGRRNFASLDFSGPEGDREMLITVYNRKGKKLWDYNIKAQDLKVK